jgi:hypothetical protein
VSTTYSVACWLLAVETVVAIVSAVASRAATSMGVSVQGPEGEKFAASLWPELNLTFGSAVDAAILDVIFDNWSTAVRVSVASATEGTSLF